MANAVMILCGWIMFVVLKTMGCGMGTWQYWVLFTLYAANNIAWMYENWKEEENRYQKLWCQTYNDLETDEMISEAKADVARGIFEEIERFNRPPIPECEPVYIIKASEFAELKKKYTED